MSEFKHLECGVCLNTYYEPCALMCGHTFCKSCLNKTNPKKCPECRDDYSRQKLSINYVIQNIINEKSITKNKGGYCKVCHNPASKYCKNCEAYICPICILEHDKSIFTNSHNVKDVLQIGHLSCSSHNHNKVEFYCNDCNKLICSNCIVENCSN